MTDVANSNHEISACPKCWHFNFAGFEMNGSITKIHPLDLPACLTAITHLWLHGLWSTIASQTADASRRKAAPFCLPDTFSWKAWPLCLLLWSGWTKGCLARVPTLDEYCSSEQGEPEFRIGTLVVKLGDLFYLLKTTGLAACGVFEKEAMCSLQLPPTPVPVATASDPCYKCLLTYSVWEDKLNTHHQVSLVMTQLTA